MRPRRLLVVLLAPLLVAAGAPTARAVPPPAATSSATSAVVGTSIEDSFALTSPHSPTGDVFFDLYADCASAALMSFTVPIASDGTASTVGSGADRSTLSPGDYHWIATYAGDGGNAGVDATCGDSGQTSTVSPADPGLAYTAPPTDAIGSPMHGTTVLSGGYAPTGKVTFLVITSGCVEPDVVATFDVPVDGNGTYTSPDYTPTALGTVHWVVDYSGDADNSSEYGGCRTEADTSVVPATPTLTTTATSAPLGSPVSDTAVLAGGYAATGTITFRLFTTCGGTPVYTHDATGSGDGTYSSGSFVPPAVGDLLWTATYSGDADNAAASEPCGTPGETSSVGKVATVLTGAASAGVPAGGQLTDVVTLAGGSAPTGTVTVALFGPGATTCTGTPLSTASLPVSGAHAYASPAVVASVPGTYTWLATYSGDASNAPSATACTAAAQHVTVTPVAPTVRATGISVGNHRFAVAYAATGRAPLSVVITAKAKGGKLLTRAATAPSGTFTFTGVGNSTAYALTLTVTSADGTARAVGLPSVTPGRVPPVTIVLSARRVTKGHKVTVSGVVGEKGDPLAHRTVVLVLNGRSHTTSTNSKGRYSFTVTVTKSGTIVVTSFASVGRSAVGKATTRVTVV